MTRLSLRSPSTLTGTHKEPALTAIDPTELSAERALEIQNSAEFQELRKTLRRFVFPMTAFFLVWYGLYVVLGAFAHDFMAIKLLGNINVGLVLGLGQFLTTFVITGLYVRFANRELDPRAAAIRAEVEQA
ncbi:Inner membrane protein YjcH [Mycobacteroides salmoniphilum]|uniref:Inner membrane protein YjcH n=1 Tax=Mycobacteroides salmoniphilum TaxID=404941 RepID=A0A4R8RXG1_9MYCO|nr:Inner membrane protein YjcH [Mycobacteroides salmoniphilum]TDZ81223.1 Inner membrane protein YjcH [Mycobacteroides salmoniphilum]TDZ88723.1 Inner membrane protein YjcH [Mycobacteroides salmoniphilum]